MKRLTIGLLAVCVFSLASVLDANAQALHVLKNCTNTFDENVQKETMKKDGMADADIDRWIMNRKLLSQQEKNTKIKTVHSGQLPVINATCGDMGGENGWGSWQGRTGTIDTYGAVTWSAWSTPPPAPTANTAFTLTSGTANDVCTPFAGNPNLPVVAPGFGNFSIRLGVPVTPNAYAEQISYPLAVTSADSNFIYSYAIVLDNPGDGNHVGIIAPHAEIFMLDALGDTIPCSHQIYFGSNTSVVPPGFFQTNCGNGYANAYKPWTTVGVNLNNYVGQNITVVVSNYDCALGGHFCHSYWDFQCGSIPLNGGCTGTQSTICAAGSSSLNPYTYQWYKNGNLLPGSTSQCIGVTQNSGDTYLVYVMSPSSCNFYMSYVAAIGSLQSLFTYSVNANTITFSDLSTGATSYSWNFGDGNTSTQQNPVNTYSAVGTYTACLAVSDGSCHDTVCKVITISVVGITENDLISSVSVFPIPAYKNIFLDFGGRNFGKAEIYLSNLIGEKIYETNISAFGKQMLDISGYTDGIYFVKIDTDYGTVTKKIIVNR